MVTDATDAAIIVDCAECLVSSTHVIRPIAIRGRSLQNESPRDETATNWRRATDADG